MQMDSAGIIKLNHKNKILWICVCSIVNVNLEFSVYYEPKQTMSIFKIYMSF